MKKPWNSMERPMGRRSLFAGAAALFASGFGARWLLEDRAAAPKVQRVRQPLPMRPGYIDVAEFKKTVTVEHLNQTAEQYFAGSNYKNLDFFLSKPLAQIEDCPLLLNSVSHIFAGLELRPGMTVIDFGAGSCWLSRWLTQLGMKVIALDVSPTALKIGQQLYERLPIIGDKPPPSFLLFDGYRIDLPDASVDRILVFDAFHHLLNPDAVLKEMSRVLRPGGIAGFSEPGPNHSRTPRSQFAIRHFKVLEDDVDIQRIWSGAQQAGFSRMRLAIHNPRPMLVSLAEFGEYLDGGKPAERFAAATRDEMEERRVFFLQKGAAAPVLDSRRPEGLAATLQVEIERATVKAGASLVARVVATNSGRATWLPHSAKPGAVLFGCHLLDGSGGLRELGYFRHRLTPGEGRAIAPGESVAFDVHIPAPARGSYILECDLMSESAGWFALFGSEPVRKKVATE
ncbi:MAG TPA: class I SAM-dependent methyltransferase [Burkholderiales bacterium]|nr:class I SAM-dependent methyltransferase [Burkholderiales bacterium]